MSKLKPKYGIFKDGIPYVKYGSGNKNLLVFSGGPGNTIPKGFMFKTFVKGLKPFLEEYTLCMVTRKSGLSENYTTKDMSDDYAEMIEQEFGGNVDLVIGISYGGIIAQHFAADHSDLFGHLVIAMAAHRMSEEGKHLDIKFAELLSQGKSGAAYRLIMNALYPEGIKRTLLKGLMWIIGLFIRNPKNERFSNDVIIEAKAEVEPIPIETLKRINFSILIIAGDKDFYFPYDIIEEMADLIEENKVVFYIDKGHNIIGDDRFAKDIFEFIAKYKSK